MVEFIVKSIHVLMMSCFFVKICVVLLDLFKKKKRQVISVCLHNHQNKCFMKLVNTFLFVNPLTVLNLVD